MDSDSLVERYKQGDKDAIQAVECKYRSRVHARIKKFFPTEDDNQFVNKVTRKVFNKARRGELKHDDLLLWIYRIQKNLCIDYVRKRQVLEKRAEKEKHMEEFEQKEAIRLRDDALENEIHNNEIKELIRDGLDGLDVKRGEVLVARLDGRSYKQIAHDLQIPLGTVKSRIHRGKKDLMHALQVKDPDLIANI